MLNDNYFLLLRCIDNLAARLDNFKSKGNNLFNFRCNICGDSKVSKSKARAFIYYQQNNFWFKCHNCCVAMSLVNYMKEYFPDLYSEYQFDRIKGINNDSIGTICSHNNSNSNDSGNQSRRLIDDLLDRIDQLPEDHDAVKYLKSRCIPDEYMHQLYYIDDPIKIGQLSEKYKEKIKYLEPRIVIPVWSKNHTLVGIYCRDIKGDSKLKYLSIRINDQEDMLYGIEKIDASKIVYVVEGQFDSMFLDNCVAVGTSDLRKGARLFRKENTVLIPDTQVRNLDIVKLVNKFIKNDYKVSLLPPDKLGKDINTFIMAGGTKEELEEMIKEHTFSGLKASLEFTKWKKV